MLHGVGLGLRWSFLDDVVASVRGEAPPLPIDFFEVCPENYMRRGGRIPAGLAEVRAAFPILSHGLTLSLGGLGPFDRAYLASLRDFVREVGAAFHSDHLCFGGLDGRLAHDLLPLPFTHEAVAHVVGRAREVRDAIGVPFAIENISYYVRHEPEEMDEPAFLRAILEQADLGLLLDVNNVYVNAQNFGFDPIAFLDALPYERVVQLHVAGHEHKPHLQHIIDTHGAPSLPAVHALLEHVVARTGPVPVVLERDNNIPELPVLCAELDVLRAAYDRGLARFAAGARGAPADSPSPAPAVREVPSVGLEHTLRRMMAALEAESLAPDDELSVYRALVRGNLRDVVRTQLEDTRALVGDARLDADVEAFVDAGLPRSHYLRDVPPAFLAFVAPRWRAAIAAGALPAHALDLATWELATYEVAAAWEDPAAAEARRFEPSLDLARPVVLSVSTRVLRLGYPVHDLPSEGPPSAAPTALVLYRDAEHEPRTLVLSPLAADIVERLAAGEALGHALRAAAEGRGVALDATLLGEISALLADYAARGILLGAQIVSPGSAGVGQAGSGREDNPR